MPIDINDLRDYKGGDPDKVRESERRRFNDPSIVDEIIKLDEDYRKKLEETKKLRTESNKLQKQIGPKKKAGEDASDLIQQNNEIKERIKILQIECDEQKVTIDKKVNLIGNYVHDSVPVSQNEDENAVVRTWGENKDTTKYHHHELLYMIGAYEPEAGSKVAGHRGYYLKGNGVLLNQALINYGLSFLGRKSYTPIQPPYFMRQEVMGETAQLEDFHEQLYKVSGYDQKNPKDKEDFYLIATSEQPISALHRGEWIEPSALPKKYAGYSTCFRKEAGAHGKDAWGIFRVHQFEKVEQFVICDPEQSWDLHEEMIATAEEFYQSLGLSYRVINLVSNELNNAAAKKYDLEAWFPTLGVYRELVSCSNCTDYQSRAMETRFGMKKMEERSKSYVHMLNSTLTATERTICCILENYQTEEGVVVPEVLRPYMGGIDFLPFVREKLELNKKSK